MYKTIVDEDIQFLKQYDIQDHLFKNKTILITGATGMIGSYLTHYFASLVKTHQVKVVALVRNVEKAKKIFKDANIEYLVQDINSPIQYANDVDYIVHAASFAGPKYFIEQPVEIMRANLLGTMNVLEFARKANTKKTIIISSIQAYGELNPTITSIKEEMYGAINPYEASSCYSEAKKASEVLALSYQRQYGINVHCIRLTHAFGPGMDIHDGRMLADFVRDGVNGKSIVLKSDGEGIRNFIYIADVISAFLIIMLHGDTITYNITNPTCVLKIKELAKVIVDLFPEKKMELIFDIQKVQGVSNVQFPVLNTDKLTALGWKPYFTIEKAMRNTILSFGENHV